jgi:BlaI family transcriptional regulator, penicillinase repressor
MKRDLDSIILTRQELQIMKVVWEHEHATVREVCNVISRNKPTAYTTILTLMGILEEKGALTHVRSGRAYLYRPLLSRRQATQNQLRDVISRFFDGRPVKLVESILENEIKERDDLRNLRSLLEGRRQHQVA